MNLSSPAFVAISHAASDNSGTTAMAFAASLRPQPGRNSAMLALLFFRKAAFAFAFRTLFSRRDV
jgi:hypothetical protein